MGPKPAEPRAQGKKLPELISADSCNEINDFHRGESSNVAPSWPKPAEPRAQGKKLQELISADSCSEINDFHKGESSNDLAHQPRTHEATSRQEGSAGSRSANNSS